ncbi:MAG: PilZ domain-containing protein [Leptospira sp.]|nr:PilZ domain-containing protein [Leptospira sp.]
MNVWKRLVNSFSPKVTVKIPVTMNVLGKFYYFHTREFTKNGVYIVCYADELDILPDQKSGITLFLMFDLYSHGKIEIQGELEKKFPLPGARMGLQISFTPADKKGKETIERFIRKFYTPRYTVRFKANISKPGSGEILVAEAINFSKNGIFLETDIRTFHEKDECDLILFTGASDIKTGGEITWVNRGNLYDKPDGLGIKFLPDRKSKREIISFLDLIEKENAVIR